MHMSLIIVNPAKIFWGNPSREILSGFGPKGQNWDSQSGIAFMADWIPIWRDLDIFEKLVHLGFVTARSDGFAYKPLSSLLSVLCRPQVF